MIKKILIFCGFLLFTQTAQSQILISIIFGDKLNSEDLEFGLDGGFNFSRITGLESTSYARDLHLGFYFDFKIKDQWWINTGVLVKSSMGANKLTENDVRNLYPQVENFQDSGSYSQSLGFFNVPVMLKYRFKNQIYAELGAQVSLLTSARLNYQHSFDDFELTTSVKNSSEFLPMDFGLVGSAGYKLRKGTGMNIGIKYYMGMVDITRSNISKNTNNVLYLKVDIPIGKEFKDDTKPKK